ncbi:MAG TPA: hypothetical protein VFT02_15785 [Pyrinomonadaceae bacterium]|nr:hypothetical protein [Pyrinomonadaceae bacterium]
MGKSTKILLGIASLWPIVYMFLFFVFIFAGLVFGAGAGEPEPGGIQPMLALIFGLHLLTMVAILALTVFYIVNIFRNDRVDKDKKALWAIVIFMGNAIAMPIYWYLYIWKEPSLVGTPPAPGQLNSASTASWTNNASQQQQQGQYVPPPQPPNWRE